MKHIRVIALALLLHIPCHGIQKAPSQSDGKGPASSPSLKETLDWLKEKIPLAVMHYVVDMRKTLGTNMGNSKDISIKTVPVKFESCTVVFDYSEATTWEKYPKNPITTTTRYTIPLGELSGVEVLKVGIFIGLSDKCLASDQNCYESKNLDVWTVWLKAKSAVILEETHEDLRNTNKSESTKRAWIGFSDESLARRVGDAFTHASELCKGKEPF